MADLPQEQIAFNALKRWTMFAKAPGVEGRMSRLTWVIRDNYPRITIYSNIPNAPNYGMTYAAMSPEIFFVMLDLLESIALGEPDQKNMIECKTSTRQEDGTPGEKRLVSTIWLGKDKEGIVWISVVSVDPNQPKIKFEFLVDEYHAILKGDGTPLSKDEGSKLQALAVVKALRLIYAQFTNGFAPRNTGNNRTNTNTSSQTSSTNKPTTTLSFDDDIAF